MSDSFHIEGGHPVSGEIRPSGNKNAALPLIAAALLTEEKVILRNVPDIRDVNKLLEILGKLGVSIAHPEPNVVVIKANNLSQEDPDARLCQTIRASVLLAGPLTARRHRVSLPPPGGDVIGRRRLDTHVLALRALGAEVEFVPGKLSFKSDGRLKAADAFLDEPAVTATENAIMAAALADGTTVFSNTASEPHVQDQ